MGAKAGEKAVDMAGKMAEKQMETLEEQKGKVDQFLGEEVRTPIINSGQYPPPPTEDVVPWSLPADCFLWKGNCLIVWIRSKIFSGLD